MRIIGGIHGGRRFEPPRKNPARPTTGVAKEGLFNFLTHAATIEGAEVLDLFAGTGSISYEFASRGASRIVAVERFRGNIAFIKETAAKLDAPIQVMPTDVYATIDSIGQPFDFIFAGPPYPDQKLPSLPERISAAGLLKPHGLFVLEHTAPHDFAQVPGSFRVLKYGQTVFSIFEKV